MRSVSNIIHFLSIFVSRKTKTLFFGVMFSTLVHNFLFFLILLNQLMRGKHLKLVAAEESIHTPHSSLNVQLLFYIIKSRPICFLKKKKKTQLHTMFSTCVIGPQDPSPALHKAANHLTHPPPLDPLISNYLKVCSPLDTKASLRLIAPCVCFSCHVCVCKCSAM